MHAPAVLPFAIAATALSPAIADERSCAGAIGRIAIDDDLRVPGGGNCTLDGTRIDGNIEVCRGAYVVDGNEKGQRAEL